MIEFEDEIYSEICGGNSHTMRQMQAMQQQHGAVAIDPANPYGTLAGVHPGGVLIPMGTLSAAAHHYGHHGPPSSTTSNQNLLLFNPNMMNSAAAHGGHHLVRGSDSASNPNSTLLRAVGAGGGGRASSRATMESALYSNVAGAPVAEGESRPSSMLYNEAGFVRFRMGGDPGRMVDEVLRQSTDDLVRAEQEAARQPPAAAAAAVVEPPHSRRGGGMGLEGLRASQSFDESVLLMDGRSSGVQSDRLSPSSPGGPRSKHGSGGPKKLSRQSPIYKSIDSLKSEEELYEAPPGMPPPPAPAPVKDSESEYEPAYGAASGNRSVQQIYNASRCSSISATQSFDMRVYGRTGAGLSGAATLGRPADRAKLDNKYYYCSTQARPARQRAAGAHKEQQSLTPRPLLPSQRNPRLGPSPTPPSGRQQAGGGATAAQSLYDQIMGRDGREQQAAQASSPQLQNFQRSRSLGHHYQREPQQGPAHLPPRPPGPRTPTSVARKVFESVTKRRAKDKQPKARPPPAGYPGLGAGPQLLATPDGRLVAAPPGQALIQLEDGRLVPAPGPLVQLEVRINNRL